MTEKTNAHSYRHAFGGDLSDSCNQEVKQKLLGHSGSLTSHYTSDNMAERSKAVSRLSACRRLQRELKGLATMAAMPKKYRPQVDRHPQKNGEGWLLNEQEQLIVCFRNSLPSAHAKWIELETRPMRGSEQPIARRMRRHNTIEAWTHMQKTGWKRCQPRW